MSGLALALAQMLPLVLLAEVSSGGERLSGLTIDKIELHAAPREDSAALLALSGLAEGAPYRDDQMRRAVKVLYQLGRFENVYVRAARAGNAVQVELLLPPRPRVHEIRIEHGNVMSDAEIERVIELDVGVALDVRTLDSKRDILSKALMRMGYRSPAIGFATQRIDLNGDTNLLLRIDEGPKTRLRKLVLEGDPRRGAGPGPDGKWFVREMLGIAPGDVLDLSRIEAGLKRLDAAYRKRGHYEVRIGEPIVVDVDAAAATPVPGSQDPLADLVLRIRAGPTIEVRFLGHAALSLRELEDAASILGEIGAGPAAIAEARERILARYERRGFWQAKVLARTRMTPDAAKKEVVFAVNEGRGSHVASISFVGAVSLSQTCLEETIHQAVEATLSEDASALGTDPETVSAILGDRSLPEDPRDSPQPTSVAEDPRGIYVDRAYRAGADAIADLYRSKGYQLAEVAFPVPTARGDSSLVDVEIRISEGIRWIVGAVSFSGNEKVSSEKLFGVAALDPTRRFEAPPACEKDVPEGQPLDFYAIEEASRAIVTHYRDQGFLYARVTEVLRSERADAQVACREAQLRGDSSCRLEVQFRIVEGPLVLTKSILVRGAESASDDLLQSEMAVVPGQPLRASDMQSTRLNLLRTGVFERVLVHPLDEDREATEKDVVAEVRERKHSAFEIGAGASTEEGVRVFAAYEHANVLGRALKFQTNLKLNIQPFLLFYNDEIRPKIESFYDTFSTWQRVERELAVGLAYPRIIGLPRGFGAGTDVIIVRNNDPAFAEDTRTLTLTGDYKGLKPIVLGQERPITFQLRASFDWSDLVCNQEIQREEFCGASQTGNARIRGTSVYTGLRPTMSVDLRDDPLDARSGAYFELQMEGAKGLVDESPDFFKVQGTFNVYFPLLFGTSLAHSFFLGVIYPLETEGKIEVPVNRRYFAGGRSTIRGYPEQSLIPEDQVDRVISTGGLLLGSIRNELRVPAPFSKALSIAGFYDIGDLYANWRKFTFSNTPRQGVGVGLRYATPVGPLSLDFAVPLVKRGDPGEVDWTLHFSVRSF